MAAAKGKDLWSDSVSERLRSAGGLSERELEAVRAALCEGCPVEPWPYGNATSINPLLVTLGPSPGNSPNRAFPDPAGRPLDLPTAGKRHPHTNYEDSRGVWDRIRYLARTILQIGGATEENAYALLGNMSLDTRRSGSVSDVRIAPVFARWVLRTIRDRLRPRYLVCFGLKSKKEALGLLEETFDGFALGKPHAEHRFRGYERRRLVFQEWDCTGPCGNEMKIVQWPQHPSRAPFTSFPFWQQACREFADRHGRLVRP